MLKPTFLIAATALFASAADWPMYLRDPAHNSFNAAENVIGRDTVAQLSPAWTFAAGAPIGSGVTVVGGVIYIGAWDGSGTI
jgi:glucose dehydrogenase